MGDQQTGTPHERVSRKMIRATAKQMYATVSDRRDEEFASSAGWINRFLLRNDFCFKEGEPCAAAREMLAQARRGEQQDDGEAEQQEEDEGEEYENELVVEDDDDDEEEEVDSDEVDE